ncbi:MAG: hypothetical protein EOP10_01270 [Proteobacteria bacterium]|nr:MAG: hypothetical protein EOP10_01270 [Pseudomonadota bacterium]
MARDHDHKNESLENDLKTLTQQLLSRRRAMIWLAAGASALPLAIACGSDTSQNAATPSADADTTASTGTDSTTGTDTTTNTTCSIIPEETAGPYPGDGSNGVNALVLSGIVRKNIKPSIGTSSKVAEGVPLSIEITLLNANGNCVELEGYAVYLWHCDRAGLYSMYSTAVKNENYLRGVQEADASGKLTFESIFPGCYDGRWPHIHFEVYKSLAAATSSKNKIATSQIALPAAQCKLAYAASGYSSSVTNLSKASLANDNVFSDGSSLQLPVIEGNATTGFTIRLVVGVKG